MSVVAVGAVSVRSGVLGHEKKHCVAGAHVQSGNIGCSSCVTMRILTWEECDTLAKKIGFILGRAFNALAYYAGKGVGKIVWCYEKIVSVLYLDIAANKLWQGVKKGFYYLVQIFSFFREKAVAIINSPTIKKCTRLTWDYCLKPIKNIIERIFTTFSSLFQKADDFSADACIYLKNRIDYFVKNTRYYLNTALTNCGVYKCWHSIKQGFFQLSRPVSWCKKKIELIFPNEKIQSGLETVKKVTATIKKYLCDKPLEYLIEYLVKKPLECIGDFFYGGISGSYRQEKEET